MPKLAYGAFHRRVVAIVEDGRVRTALEDETHHMEVTVYHDGRFVAGIEGASHRIPWSTCPGAHAKIKALIGLPLQRMNQTTGQDAKEHCTHLFDLTRLAIARAAVNRSVQYDAAVPDRVDGRTRAELLRDGNPFIVWEVTGNSVTGPEPYTGHHVLGAPKWSPGLDDGTIEAALVLRRTLMVSMVRSPEADGAREGNLPEGALAQMIKDEGRTGRCFTYKLPMFDDAKPNHTWINYAGRRDELLMNFPGTRAVADMVR